MKKMLLLGFIGLLLAGCGTERQSIRAPHRIGGFVLGDDISGYRDRLAMKTALPLRYMESLYEVEIKETPWFKSGLICFGQCAEPGKIIRIKLKYKDSSKKFYNELLRRYKRRFGKPDEWRGDPFQVMIAWKWSFEDRNGNNISMILQHNLQDMEEKIGNVIKISLINGLEKEKRCLEARQGKKELPAGSLLIPLEQIGQDDWDMLLPR